jgi:hypothetical protein
MRHLLVLLTLLGLCVTACGGTPTPDLEATVVAAIAATQAAQPTDTPTPTSTNTPTLTNTPQPTDTPTPLDTPTSTPTPTTTSTPTPTPYPGQAVQTMCLVVEQFYPDAEGGISQPIEETLQSMLTEQGVRVVAEGGSCDATLSIVLTGKALSGRYKVESSNPLMPSIPNPLGGANYKSCATGVQFTGEMTLTTAGHTPQTVSLHGRKEPTSGTIYTCPNASQAPYRAAWRWAVTKGLAQLWGPPILIQALEDEAAESYRDAIVAALQEMTGQNLGGSASGWQKWWEEHRKQASALPTPAPTDTPQPTVTPAETPTGTPTPIPPPTETATLTLQGTPTASSDSELGGLLITFDPNPVTPTQDEEGNWVWWLTFSVHNPNDYPVQVLAFGNFNECLGDISLCSYETRDFASWFTGCGPGSPYVPAHGTACDHAWWISQATAPREDVMGRYAVYYEGANGEISAAISEPLTLRKP